MLKKPRTNMVQFLFSSSKMDERHVNTILCSWEAIHRIAAKQKFRISS
jgi:hypothetical protein